MSPASGDAAVLIGALRQRGYTLGQNLTYEARGAAGKLSQMPQRGGRVLHCSRVEAVSSREKKNAKFGITNARGIFQYGLEYRLPLTPSAPDDAQRLCGRRLLLQRLGEVLPSLGEFAPVVF